MFRNNPRIGQELLDVPMGDMIKEMAFAIAEAQMRLDENSMEVAEMMGGLKTVTRPITKPDGTTEEVVTFEDSRVFFGQEKISVSDAVTVYNTTKDEALKEQIYKENTANSGGTSNGKNENIFESDGVDKIKEKGSNTIKEIITPLRLSMLELGFTPTFYQFVDTVIQCAITIKFTREGSSSVSVSNKNERKSGGVSFGFRRGLRSSRNVSTSQVNANYSQKYSYSAEGSSLLRTKLVPIPPPAILEERIQQQMELARERSTT
ncbi:conserved hypothetical protein [Tenacibaculum maritimum]|uniref:hypothetical protein n=1 Tax=Tenacibaculum maritimum TaxID=107401 RepID=UPI0012E41B7B|nr:hypothetical protein [Tenacibaculum maritimum]CAA0257190.1 conserved hypothetical protein [Tenacibaculum maritimum]